MSWIKKCWFYIALIVSIGAFCLFRGFLNDNSEALMVLITTIYVIATIQISNANIDSAKATQKQITESNRQFTESKHLQIMPFVQASFSHAKRYYYDIELPCSNEDLETEKDSTIITIENVGKGSANNITYTWLYNGIQAGGDFGMVGIREGNLFDIRVHFKGDLIKENGRGSLILHYSDLLGRWYKQTVFLQFLQGEADGENMKIWTEIPIVDQSRENPNA